MAAMQLVLDGVTRGRRQRRPRLGPVLRATQVMEARVVREEPVGRIETPRDVYALALTLGADEWPEERFVVLCLDTQNNVRHVQEITRGVLDGSVVHPREVFWLAVHERAAAVILVHNHPSGDPTPSAADRAVTRQMTEAGRVLGIPVRDHIVVGRGWFVSFLEASLLSSSAVGGTGVAATPSRLAAA